MYKLRQAMQATRNGLRIIHEDEQGADALEKLLIIAAIVLPLLGVLYVMRNQLSEWVDTIWEEMRGRGRENIEPGS
jgi:Flp pilus assembly pilin Flp